MSAARRGAPSVVTCRRSSFCWRMRTWSPRRCSTSSDSASASTMVPTRMSRASISEGSGRSGLTAGQCSTGADGSGAARHATGRRRREAARSGVDGFLAAVVVVAAAAAAAALVAKEHWGSEGGGGLLRRLLVAGGAAPERGGAAGTLHHARARNPPFVIMRVPKPRVQPQMIRVCRERGRYRNCRDHDSRRASLFRRRSPGARGHQAKSMQVACWRG